MALFLLFSPAEQLLAVLLERWHGLYGVPVEIKTMHKQHELFIGTDLFFFLQIHAADFFRIVTLVTHGSHGLLNIDTTYKTFSPQKEKRRYVTSSLGMEDLFFY